MFKRAIIVDFIIILVILQFIVFFSLRTIPETSFFRFQASSVLGVLMAVFLAFSLLSRNGIQKAPLDTKILLFILSMFLSSVMADLFWDQSFIISLRGYASFYIYLLYFVFAILDFTSERVIRIMEILFYLSLIVFAVDFITLPESLFSYRNEERRNGVTIWFYGQGFTFLGTFHFLNKYFKTRSLYYLGLFVAGAFCLFVLTQSRMNLLAITLGFFILLLSSNIKWKYLMTVAVIAGGVIFYSSSDIFSGVRQASAEQGQYYKEDIRVSAQEYFLTGLQAGVTTMIFGNGVPSGTSHLGLKSLDANSMGYWTADVGLTGLFSYFGIFGVLVWISFFYSAFTMRKTEYSGSVKAYFLTLLTTAFTGFSIFDPGYMPATVLALYLIRCQNLQLDEEV